MKKVKDFQDLAFAMFDETAKRGLMYHAAEDEALDGRHITVNGRSWLNFGSCSYLGLELEPALKDGVIAAVERFGTQFSSSRAMVSAPPYAELEALLGQIFDEEPLISSSTSLGHIGAIPMLVDEDDAIVLDQQVHMSVEMATRLARVNGTPIHIVRHNRLDLLEEKIAALGRTHRKVWYMADGLYSMYGDLAPLDGLMALLEQHEQLHLYVDDAHAMSWTGRHGRGFVLGRYPLHERMVVATSLNKAFACAGGVLLMRDAAMRKRLKTVGGPYIYSGPIQPPMLGAAVASARLHLSPTLERYQAELLHRIQHCNRLLVERGMPLMSRDETPVRFVGTGLPSVTYALVDRLQAEGLYVNAATFPVVPMKRAGIRFTITRHHTLADLERLADAIARHLPPALAEEGSSLAEVRAAFELPDGPAEAQAAPAGAGRAAAQAGTGGLTLERHEAIAALDAAEWDALLGAKGSFTADGLAYLERTFQGNPLPEDNWRFYYYLVRDAAGVPVLATFFTEALWKDDMIAAPRVSRYVEAQRAHDRYFLTTRTFAMGALLTEGDHLYLDRTRDWRQALTLLLKAVKADAASAGAPMLVFRDLATDDQALEAFLLGKGFAKFAMPESLVAEVDWQTDAEHLKRVSPKSRRHLRLAVHPFNEAFDVEVLTHRSAGLASVPWERLYELYRNVQVRGLEYNTFALPERFLRQAMDHACWEIVVLRLKAPPGGPAVPRGEPVAFMLAFVGPAQYAPLVAGLDYAAVASHGAYRQLLRQAFVRARAHGRATVLLGMGAAFEKHRFGARVEARSIYFQTDDAYPLEVLAKLYADADRAG